MQILADGPIAQDLTRFCVQLPPSAEPLSQRPQQEYYKSLPIFECWIKGFVVCLLIPLKPLSLLNRDNRLLHISITLSYSDSKEFQYCDVHPDLSISFCYFNEHYSWRDQLFVRKDILSFTTKKKNMDSGIFKTVSQGGVFESKKGRKWHEHGEYYIMRDFIFHTLYQILWRG